MSKHNDGGPAFPAIQGRTEGMSLRDFFAAHALSGIASHTYGPAKKGSETSGQAHARWAYGMADEMLEARK